ncbi:MAG: GntR family transcriptional regulator [Pseudomonadota bacterium]
MSLTAGEKITRVDDAYLRLKEAIRSSDLAPNEQLTEPEIAGRLGMSRTPVREALIRLTSDGLVKLIPRHGALILPVSKKDMEEIYDILSVLEPAAAYKLAERRPSAEVLKPLYESVQNMQKAVEAEDLEAWAQADDAFHTLFLELQGNSRIVAMVSVLYDQAHRARVMTLNKRKMPVQSTREHSDILQALSDGDPQRAHDLFKNHRERAAKELLALM